MKDKLITFTTTAKDDYSVRLSDIIALRQHNNAGVLQYHVILRGVDNFIEVSEDTEEALARRIDEQLKAH